MFADSRSSTIPGIDMDVSGGSPGQWREEEEVEERGEEGRRGGREERRRGGGEEGRTGGGEEEEREEDEEGGGGGKREGGRGRGEGIMIRVRMKGFAQLHCVCKDEHSASHGTMVLSDSSNHTKTFSTASHYIHTSL